MSTKYYVADFETTTKIDDCRVWAWGIANIETPNEVTINRYIHEFIDHVSNEDAIIFFHNLRFDGQFIIDYILKHGYTLLYGQREKMVSSTFKCLMSNSGKMYSIRVKWSTGKTTEFRDSLKKLPMKVSEVARAFHIEEGKGEIDYRADRPLDHVITEEERDYLRRDVSIIAEAMQVQIHAGLTKLTQGADAMAQYKAMTGPLFKTLFPTLSLELDGFIRQAYRGGFTYADPRFARKIQGPGKVYDENSLYPYVMASRPLPYGEPLKFSGPPIPNSSFDLFIFSVTITAKIKPNHIPCIQLKGYIMYGNTEYLSELDQPTTLWLTSVDWELYNEHYDIDVIAWGGGYKFRSKMGMFDEYINYWMKIKSNSIGGARQIAKNQLTSLYGKFATNPDITGKYPVLENGIVKFVLGDRETRQPVYTAIGVFVTAYGRSITIRAAQSHYDVFAYADTDSLHLLTNDEPSDLNIHPSELGAWKHELDFTNALYVRPKAYLERLHDGHYENHIAGLPKEITDKLIFADIYPGAVFRGKLAPKYVPGGVVLVDTDYTLQY